MVKIVRIVVEIFDVRCGLVFLAHSLSLLLFYACKNVTDATFLVKT